MIHLESLAINFNEVRDGGCQHLRKLANLKELNIRVNNIGDLGGYHIAFLSNLIHLDLSNRFL
jgi:hypothetical protein